MKSWQIEALAHAREEYERGRFEACGLVVERDGAPKYIRARNSHETPHADFQISAEEFAAAEEMGEIVAVFHSHPDAPCHPSEADRMACEGSQLPWYILGLPDAVWGFCEPCGYEMPYEGRPFIHGQIDCYTLIRDWYRRERRIELPDFERPNDWWRRGLNLYEDLFQEAGFRRITLPELRDGDVILMELASPDRVINHGGVLVNAARNHLLHHVHGRTSETTVYGGFWRDISRLFLRHHQCDK